MCNKLKIERCGYITVTAPQHTLGFGEAFLQCPKLVTRMGLSVVDPALKAAPLLCCPRVVERPHGVRTRGCHVAHHAADGVTQRRRQVRVQVGLAFLHRCRLTMNAQQDERYGNDSLEIEKESDACETDCSLWREWG